MNQSTENHEADAHPPLKGLRVLELGQYIAAPAAGQILADLGADVIKLEPPAGDASRRLGWTKDDCGSMFSAYNRDKRSVVLDVRQPEGRALATQLALRADVVLANPRPGALEKQGLGAQQLLVQAQRLVYGRVSAFGQTGPATSRPGFDIAAQAESAMMSLNGEAGRGPVCVGFTAVDILARQSLATGVPAALVRRGNGQAAVAPAAEVIATRDGMIVLSAYMDDHFRRRAPPSAGWPWPTTSSLGCTLPAACPSASMASRVGLAELQGQSI